MLSKESTRLEVQEFKEKSTTTPTKWKSSIQLVSYCPHGVNSDLEFKSPFLACDPSYLGDKSYLLVSLFESTIESSSHVG